MNRNCSSFKQVGIGTGQQVAATKAEALLQFGEALRAGCFVDVAPLIIAAFDFRPIGMLFRAIVSGAFPKLAALNGLRKRVELRASKN
ncbi:MAG: hypothetical protein IT427_19430 [Pirellulales bacterium]|nr:hypothetical protein [Pirellulales bacterium]